MNWATKVDMDKNSQDLRPAAGRAEVLDRAERRGRELQGHLPGGARHQGPAAGGLLAEDQPVLRADQPRLHGLRAVPGELHRRASPMSARRCRCTRLRTAMAAWATSSPGTRVKGKIVWSNAEQFSVWSGALATAGDVVFYGTLEGYLKAVDAKTARSCTSSRPRRASSATS